jgi:nicotinamidase/pyrazinamidase
MKKHLVIIDPQNDFMDYGALPVAGGNDDMDRLSVRIDDVGDQYDEIHVTLDSHQTCDGRSPVFWRNRKGDHPVPTNLGGGMITKQDILSGTWSPIGSNLKPKILGGKSVKEFMVVCAEEREAAGIPGIEIWSPHCLIGTPGQAVQANLRSSLCRWEEKFLATINWWVKGANPYTEHYGALMANVPIPADPGTGLNTRFIQVLNDADVIDLAGEAGSHCLLTTVNQIADSIGKDNIKKLRLLIDCTSPIAAAPGADFPEIFRSWVATMQREGMTVIKSTDL